MKNTKNIWNLKKNLNNMKYYCECISVSLAEKLKEKGMPITYSNHPHQIAPDVKGIVMGNFKEIDCPTFGACFDWLMSKKGWLISIGREYDFATEQVTERFEWAIDRVGCFSSQPDEGGGWCDTWHEAAEEAIEKALTLI